MQINEKLVRVLLEVGGVNANRMPESWLSSLNDARMAALSFWMTARSSAIVLAERTFRINCLTVYKRRERGRQLAIEFRGQGHGSSIAMWGRVQHKDTYGMPWRPQGPPDGEVRRRERIDVKGRVGEKERMRRDQSAQSGGR